MRVMSVLFRVSFTISPVFRTDAPPRDSVR